MRKTEVIVWDFDGVLNRNLRGGRLIWSENFETDTGQTLAGFQAAVFEKNFHAVMTGKRDLRDVVAAWTQDVGYDPGPDALLDYWFSRDALPDARMLALLERTRAAGVRAVIGTNNEARRSAYIEAEMGFGEWVEKLYSSGRMGVAKPDPRFFGHIAEDLNLPHERLMLIDDSARNVDAAQALGWRAFHFTEDGHAELERELLGG